MSRVLISAKKSHSRFLNRELSWLEFNQRVLDEALSADVPLLERVKFLCICHSNLDEFFEVRVAGLKQQIESDVVERGPDGLTASETLRQVLRRTRRLIAAADACWRDQLVPRLAEQGIQFLEVVQLCDADRAWVESYYQKQVHPVLTPLAVDPSHPFPHLLNKSLNLAVRLSLKQNGVSLRRLAFVQAPRVLPRLVKLPRDDSRQDYVFLAHVIEGNLTQLFPGTTIEGCWQVRVTRNSELYIDEEETSNVLTAVENELHNRRRGEAVRLEVERECPADVQQFLLEQLGLVPEDLFVIEGEVNPIRLMAILEGDHSPELRDAPFISPVAVWARGSGDLFQLIRERDQMLHHPYESFDTVIRFLQEAAGDPQVLAIKQTLYRTGGDARVVEALMEAARNGKQVTAVVELKARFDEANNIQWARRLEDAGVHVVYGLVGWKIHCKITLVVRQDEDRIRRYVHLATGNYNPSTARFYTDIGVFTARPEFGEDATNLFNLLTGICHFQGTRRLAVAPYELHSRLLTLIEREAGHARRGIPGRIIIKLNALVDGEIIEALYAASSAGVQIDLIVRGICCLRPGVEGLSENITVRSIVDRFLEHTRIYWFSNGFQPDVYLASADWMPRNFFRRIEVAYPIEDGVLRERITSEILTLSLADNVKAHFLQPEGSYSVSTPKKGERPLRSQTRFMEIARARSRAVSTRQATKGDGPVLRPRPA
ncbi:MAG: polyphosphate kinase 1 [Pedosphaera sp.]|nr:polyphosphate kinase 1 [Pedosphaera sp.]